ncbi:MAG TPA: zinc dependent phospholipase C family protein, partial [Candidatus Saccharimonadales bacterium]|nr:zinc dependent phospholipase C family protein [Candidatus Saccharimonadales bacterium]
MTALLLLRPLAFRQSCIYIPMGRFGPAVLRLIVLACLLAFATPASSYSLLTHEQLIDLTWDDSIVPFLLSRYPGLTPAQLQEARSYAYGGCVIQDIGYYPFGHTQLADLMHYVRSGDFIVALLRNAQDADELAFAVGALSHYIGDSIGHPMAVNIAVGAEFPKLQRRFGHSVNYAEGPHQHVRAEFAFDIDEAAHDRMAPLAYLKHIGLNVSMRQLSLAFYQTYGYAENFSGNRRGRVNVRAYRFAVRRFIPRVAEAVTLLHRHSEPPDVSTAEAVALRSEIAQMEKANNWAAYRRRPGIGTWLLAGIIFILPKVGPLQLAAVKGPTPQAEADYQHSVALSVAALRQMLSRFTPPGKRRPL